MLKNPSDDEQTIQYSPKQTRKLLLDPEIEEQAFRRRSKITDDVPPWRISLTMLKYDVQMVFDITGPVLLGRDFKEVPDTQFIDLSLYDALELGISRHHATISLSENNNVTITDQNSMNGIILNNSKLIANKPYILHNGDHIMLGKMKLIFSMIYNVVTMS